MMPLVVAVAAQIEVVIGRMPFVVELGATDQVATETIGVAVVGTDQVATETWS